MTCRTMAHGIRQVLLVVFCVTVGGSVWPTRLDAQVTDVRARREVERLRQQDASLRSSIQGQQIDRQAEIGRLEARIVKLERLVRGLPPRMDNTGLIELLVTLEEGQVLTSGLPAATEDQPEPSDSDRQRRRQQVLQLIAQDYMAALQVEALEMKVALLEHSAQLSSLQRLATKGLATRPQLELQQLKHENAEAQYARLEQQQAGLLKLFPAFFSVATLPAPKEDRPPSPNKTP